MKKTNTFKKIARKVFLHTFEVTVFYLIALWIQAIAPVSYIWPSIVLLGLVYVVYLASSLVDDYLDIQGADFMI